MLDFDIEAHTHEVNLEQVRDSSEDRPFVGADPHKFEWLGFQGVIGRLGISRDALSHDEDEVLVPYEVTIDGCDKPHIINGDGSPDDLGFAVLSAIDREMN